MNLGEILSPDQILTNLNASDQWQAIDELIDKLIAVGKVDSIHRETMAKIVKKRESSQSTGIGYGIGIPHATTPLVGDVIGVFGRSEKGINFDACDNQPVKLIILLLIPQDQYLKHLHTLASIAKLLQREELRNALETAPDPEKMFEIIRSNSR